MLVGYNCYLHYASNIECFDVFNLNPRKDIFYAMSHGVNRATLKKGKNDSNPTIIKKYATNYGH